MATYTTEYWHPDSCTWQSGVTVAIGECTTDHISYWMFDSDGHWGQIAGRQSCGQGNGDKINHIFSQSQAVQSISQTVAGNTPGYAGEDAIVVHFGVNGIPITSNMYFGGMANYANMSNISPQGTCYFSGDIELHGANHWEKSNINISHNTDKHGSICWQRRNSPNNIISVYDFDSVIGSSIMGHQTIIHGGDALDLNNAEVSGKFTVTHDKSTYVSTEGGGRGFKVEHGVEPTVCEVNDSCFHLVHNDDDNTNIHDLAVNKCDLSLNIASLFFQVNELFATGYKGNLTIHGHAHNIGGGSVFGAYNIYLAGAHIDNLTINMEGNSEAWVGPLHYSSRFIVMVMGDPDVHVGNVAINVLIHTFSKAIKLIVTDLRAADGVTINVTATRPNLDIATGGVGSKLDTIPIVVGGIFDPNNPQPGQNWSGNTCNIDLGGNLGEVPISLLRYGIPTNSLGAAGTGMISAYYLPDGKDLASAIVRKYDFSPLFIGDIGGDTTYSNGAEKIIIPSINDRTGAVECS